MVKGLGGEMLHVRMDGRYPRVTGLHAMSLLLILYHIMSFGIDQIGFGYDLDMNWDLDVL